MFEIFKKKRIYQFSDREINFFREVIKLLPTRYHYFLNQLNREFLISFKPNDLNLQNWYSIQMNAKLEYNYNNSKLGYFQLQGIFILNKKSKKKEKVILSFFEGMFIGFFIEDIKFDNFILSEYDTSYLKEKHFKNENDKNVLLEILKNLSKDQKSRLDIESTFKIEIPEGIFYTIKNLNDGNYLVVNYIGEVYKIVHDPYSVKKLADSIVDFEI